MFNTPRGGDRRVTSVSVNEAGYVTHLWNDDSDWSPQTASDAILDEELGIHQYYVRGNDDLTEITDGEDAGGRFLLGRHAGERQNLLLELPRHVG
jgi:hypothetical protein